MAERILILGGGGTLGHKLWQFLPGRFPETYVAIRKPKAYYERCGLFAGPNVFDSLDLRDFSRLTPLLDELRPTVIVNAAGVTLRSKEALDKISAISMNALLPHKLAEWCGKNGSRLIHFSTACVFDGRTGNYNEDDLPNARDLYGMTKALGDLSSPCALTLRSSFLGREIFGGTELLEWFLSQRGKKVRGFRKALFTGLTTNRLSELAGELIAKFPALNGLYHISSETISKYELLKLIKEVYRADTEIEPDDQFECRRNLDGARFVEATGFKCPSWPRMMRDMAEDKTRYDDWRE